jgi:ubiquitin-like 1-activating enzyme E1 B
MDTIELSNLNRQFYFRQKDIGKFKAEILAKKCQEQNPSVEVFSYNQSIYETKFGIGFYSKFDGVYMALDNIEARMHTNKMCFLTGTFVIDAGTNGMNGQAYPIFPGVSKCY